MALLGITLDEWMEAFSTGGLSLIMGTKKHNHHSHCEHEEVAYCGHCQVVYCKGCKREWSDCKLSHSPYTYIYPYTNPPYWTTTTASDILTCDTSGVTVSGTVDCPHSHV